MSLLLPRVRFRTAVRAAMVDLLRDFASEANQRLSVTPGRPGLVQARAAWVESIRETVVYTGPRMRQRTPTVEAIILWGQFDSSESVQQADDFTDQFMDWVTDRYHAAHANTLVAVTEVEDEPTYVNDWSPPAEQKTWYATRITMEGFANG
jgi:hypothetical protein